MFIGDLSIVGVEKTFVYNHQSKATLSRTPALAGPKHCPL